MTILIIEPFYGGSHKQLIDFLTAEFRDFELIALTAKKWHWRARTSALYLSQSIPKNPAYDRLFCSSVLNLCELVALRPDLGALKKVIYFHENQLAYPVKSSKGERDFQYGYNQILSALTADSVVFNSRYNRDSFLTNIDSFLKLQPDYRVEGLKERIEPKCSVIYFPIPSPLKGFQREKNDVLRILWPHRWEYDKNPDAFFRVLFRLKEEGLPFRVSVLGERFSEAPAIFEEAETRLDGRILHWGFLENKADYGRVLAESHVVVSTAVHEFFGVAVLEAVFSGCYPLVPNRLVYPELFPKEFLYSTDQQLFKRLRDFCKKPHLTRVVESSFLNSLENYLPEKAAESFKEVLE